MRARRSTREFSDRRAGTIRAAPGAGGAFLCPGLSPKYAPASKRQREFTCARVATGIAHASRARRGSSFSSLKVFA